MNFGEALQALKEGKKVTRSIWGGYWEFWNEPILNAESEIGNGYKKSCQFLNGLIVAVLKDNGGVAPAQPYQSDLLAEDWGIID
jgi:hypothetical protein